MKKKRTKRNRNGTINKGLEFLRAMLLRAVRERKRECLAVGAGTAVVIAAVGSLMGSKPMIVKQMGEITVTQEASGQKRKNQIPGMMILTGRSPVVMQG